LARVDQSGKNEIWLAITGKQNQPQIGPAAEIMVLETSGLSE
jgi:hypothetical protein